MRKDIVKLLWGVEDILSLMPAGGFFGFILGIIVAIIGATGSHLLSEVGVELMTSGGFFGFILGIAVIVTGVTGTLSKIGVWIVAVSFIAMFVGLVLVTSIDLGWRVYGSIKRHGSK